MRRRKPVYLSVACELRGIEPTSTNERFVKNRRSPETPASQGFPGFFIARGRLGQFVSIHESVGVHQGVSDRIHEAIPPNASDRRSHQARQAAEDNRSRAPNRAPEITHVEAGSLPIAVLSSRCDIELSSYKAIQIRRHDHEHEETPGSKSCRVCCRGVRHRALHERLQSPAPNRKRSSRRRSCRNNG